jgi:hypothetical protein
MALKRISLVSGAAVGSDGSATISADTVQIIRGVVKVIHLAYAGDDPGSTDVTITEKTAPYLPVLSVGNNATDGFYYPAWLADDAADGAAMAEENAIPIQVQDQLTLTVDEANTGDIVTATIWYDDLTGP